MAILVAVILIVIATASCEEYKKLKLEDVDVEFFDPTIIDETTFDISINYKADGKTSLNVLIDIIEDLTEDVYVKVKVYGQALGAYKVPTGISLDMNICHNNWNEYFFKVLFEALGSLDTNCPWKKGRYELSDFNIDKMGLPMPVLSGFRILLDSETYTKSMTISKIKAYFKVI